MLLMTYLINYVSKQNEGITRIDESKTLRKHVSCGCKCKFDCGKFDRNDKWHNDKCRFQKKSYMWLLVMKL